MAYIGRSVDIGMFEKQVLTADSSTTTFTLTFAVGSANSLLVVYGGVIQEPAVAYSVSGGGQQIVFSEAPATGTTTYIIYLGKQLTTPRAAGQETTKQTFTGNGSTVTYTLTDPPVVPAGIMVFVDGILQREGSGNNYVSSGSTITFSTAPDTSAEIDVYTLVKEKVSIDTVADGSITFAKLVAGSPTWNGAGETVIATASTGNSLRITNTGSGNSLLVEDSASTDSSPFVITAAGDVGVGTASPTQKLDVVGSIKSSALTAGRVPYASTGGLLVDSANMTYNGTSLTLASDTTVPTLSVLGNSATPNLRLGSQGNTSVYWQIGRDNLTTGDFIFSTQTAERVRITDAGNVGIGISSPQYKLVVAASGGNSFEFGPENTTSTNMLQSYNRTTSAYTNLVYNALSHQFNVSGGNAVTINSSGNVGIGTTSPSTEAAAARLALVGTATQDANSLATSNTKAVFSLRGDSNSGYSTAFGTLTTTDDQYIQGVNFAGGAASCNLVLQPFSGNLGIGTGNSAPASKLDIFADSNSGFHYPIFLSGKNSAAAKRDYLQLGFSIQQNSAGSETGGFDLKALRNNTPVYIAQYEGAAGVQNWRFYTEGSERMRISSGGAVGIGNSSPAAQNLHVGSGAGGSTAINGYTRLAVEASDYAVVTVKCPAANFSQIIFADSATTNLGGINYFGSTNATPNAMTFLTGGGTERMRILSGGNVLINDTTDAGGAGGRLHITGNGSQAAASIKIGTNGYPGWYFVNTSGTKVGDIVINSSSTTYNTTSDYRLKNTIAPMTGALAKVAQLKPVTYKWNTDGSSSQGFIAHELQAVIPDCVTGEKDAVDADDKPIYQGIDTSFLVATLTAAIQELKAIVDAQAVEIAALKVK